MPIYTFKLIDDCGGVEDDTGVSLPSAEVANQYACDVVAELMDRREDATRTWRLDVYNDGTRIFELPFASLDHTLDHLKLSRRNQVEQLCRQRRLLSDLVNEAELTLREAHALLARSQGGKPHLAVVGGKRVIRD
jgi:hypothetical protein